MTKMIKILKSCWNLSENNYLLNNRAWRSKMKPKKLEKIEKLWNLAAEDETEAQTLNNNKLPNPAQQSFVKQKHFRRVETFKMENIIFLSESPSTTAWPWQYRLRRDQIRNTKHFHNAWSEQKVYKNKLKTGIKEVEKMAESDDVVMEKC